MQFPVNVMVIELKKDGTLLKLKENENEDIIELTAKSFYN